MKNMRSESESETAAVAVALAKDLRPGDVVLLHGTLGMGKSVFARGLIRTLSGQDDLDVPSPTFTLVQLYDGPDCPIYHYDLYRIENPDEILELGWEDALADGITLVEWPERLGPYTPRGALEVTFSVVDGQPDAREIIMERTER